jgi:3-phosphoshikimate 1-carboxyvinyltransferase
MNPSRARLLDILILMGLKISVAQLEEHHGELIGAIEARGRTWRGAVISGADTAALIDGSQCWLRRRLTRKMDWSARREGTA